MPRSRTKRSGTILDIRSVAEAAGVSPATVSRVLNGVSSVNKNLAARVNRTVAELGYRPNEQARALVTRRSRTLGLLISEITNPFFPELIQSFQSIANDHGYEVLIGSTNYRPDRAPNLIRQFVQRKIEGVAVMTFREETELLRPLLERQVPVVSIDAEIGGEGLTAVMEVDYVEGMLQAVRHLAAFGHRSIAFVGGPSPHRTNLLRLQAFQKAMALVGVEPTQEWLIESDHTPDGGMRAAEQLMAGPQRPTAIICSNDMTALGVMRLAHRTGARIPKDLSLIGLDDIHLSEFLTPALTSIQLSRDSIATQAFGILENLKNSRGTSRNDLRISTRLMRRETTGDVPSGLL